MFGQKLDTSREAIELNRRKDACNCAKYPQCNPFEMGEEIFKFLSNKTQKIDFRPKMAKKHQK